MKLKAWFWAGINQLSFTDTSCTMPDYSNSWSGWPWAMERAKLNEQQCKIHRCLAEFAGLSLNLILSILTSFSFPSPKWTMKLSLLWPSKSVRTHVPLSHITCTNETKNNPLRLFHIIKKLLQWTPTATLTGVSQGGFLMCLRPSEIFPPCCTSQPNGSLIIFGL